MDLNILSAISPVDGRYRRKTEPLAEYYSEYALIRYRIKVEVEYFIALCELPLPQLQSFDKSKYEGLRDIYRNYGINAAERVKAIEEETNHDVKAVEYYLKEQFRTLDIQQYSEFIHFGLTSQDINNTAIPLSNRDAIEQIYTPYCDDLMLCLRNFVKTWATVPMLARTHGQPASPTRLGKEFAVFVERLEVQLAQFRLIPFSAKFGGATGNFNAHHVAYPEIDWKAFANNFVDSVLGLKRSQTTTQIEHYDNFAAQCDALKRINSILTDMCRDIWTYVSQEYFRQKIVKAEVGSSAMPHKVNPIDFENAEGNLGLANSLFEHLAAKLPVSRLQRDLTDSTVLRNIGVPMAHTIIAFHSILKGLNKLIVNYPALDADLTRNWIVVSEGIQTVLRREGFPKPYEALKELTRTSEEGIDKHRLNAFIDRLDVSPEVKEELKQITPFNYTGI
ncbi:MAG: adenylosuccinate lyase [Bacteroidales bacterium]|jgi:adenylosuccinate lyase|nr:adenylosuccinate lyase [Bacteroidales bacterium]